MATTEQFIAASEKAANELLKLEEDATTEASGPLARWLAQARVLAEENWPGDDAPLEKRVAVGLAVAARLKNAPLSEARSTLLAVLDGAADHGARAAVAMAKLSGSKLKPETAQADTAKQVRKTYAAYAKQLSVARSRVLTAKTLRELLDGADLAMTVGSRSGALSQWAVADAYHGSLDKTARQDDSLRLVWKAERDACLHCLAYQGEITVPGTGYRDGLTYGDHAPKTLGNTTKPPLHPRCRCEQIVWREGAESGSPISLPQALKREAQRSVLRGWADASGPARGRAARRLLDDGVKAPASVLAAAKRLALKYGV